MGESSYSCGCGSGDMPEACSRGRRSVIGDCVSGDRPGYVHVMGDR